MTANAPTFSIGQIVYLRESASIGFLEPMKISGIFMLNNGWAYTISNDGPLHRSSATFGDRVSTITGSIIYYTESEFISLYDALVLVEANAQRALEKVQAQRAALFPEGT